MSFRGFTGENAGFFYAESNELVSVVIDLEVTNNTSFSLLVGASDALNNRRP